MTDERIDSILDQLADKYSMIALVGGISPEDRLENINTLRRVVMLSYQLEAMERLTQEEANDKG